MLRMLDRVSLKEHIPSTVLREKYGLPSVNQLAAEIKILEAWKSINVDNYPFQMELANPERNTQGRSIRETTEKKWDDLTHSKASELSCSKDIAKLWNITPQAIKNAKTLNCAKTAIKVYCRSLPQ